MEHWRGSPFHEWSQSVLSYISWDGHPAKDGVWIEPPKSVTFPLCCACGQILWDQPVYEEDIPDEWICSACFIDASEEA
jgi:hypothetical protein